MKQGVNRAVAKEDFNRTQLSKCNCRSEITELNFLPVMSKVAKELGGSEKS